MLRSASRLASRHSAPLKPHRHIYSRVYSTGESPPPPSQSTSSAALIGFATSAIIASYFLWPDISKAAPTKKHALLSPTHFTPVPITSTEPCPDPNTRLMTLTLPRKSRPSLEDATLQPIWSVYIKDDDIQVERPFTPLEGMDSDGRIKFWIKKYEKGEVGRWLHSKNAGDKIEIRGPVKTWPWQADEWDEVIMISGGTGITPFCQLLHRELLSQPKPNTKTRFTLLHSSLRPAELPPSEVLQPLIAYSQSHPDKLRLSLFVDTSEGPAHPTVPSSSLTVGRIRKEAIERATRSDERSWWQSIFGASPKPRSQNDVGAKKVMFLVCGPDPMVAAIAGPFGRNFSQGEVGGVLGKLGYDSGTVRKL